MPRQYSAKDFDVVFNDLVALTTDRTKADVSPLEVLRARGFEMGPIPKALEPKLMVLRKSRGSVLAAEECGACGICGVCAICAEVNAGVAGAAAAAIWAVL
jgi:hypothetical protein